ncbi:MAG: DUF2510 domain-containing protein [Blastococcus sp.]
MTGPGQPAPPPGWYPDPDGSPGLVRWWDGATWSDVATPAGPGVAVRSAPVLAPQPHLEAPPPLVEDEPPPPGAGIRTGWIVGLSVLALVVVIVAGLVMGRSGEAAPEAQQPSSSAPAPAPRPADPTFAPGTVRIIDEQSGISYPFLGDGWFEWSLGGMYEVTSIAGQFFTTQQVTPDATRFIAQCTSGPLADGFGWTGPDSLQATTTAIADSVRFNYYPGPNERVVRRDEARTVDGHAAHLYEFQLAWDAPGYDATGERAALLLIDVGRPAPALLYISIPNTHAELYGVIDRVIEAVDVL